MDHKEFYIGWQDEMPPETATFLRRIIQVVLILLPLLALCAVLFQRPFNNHKFELGQLSTLTGIYHAKPVPILEVALSDVPPGFSPFILLVGYGKFGAEGIMDDIQVREGQLDGQNVSIEGTLIYGDGKALLELTKKGDSFLSKSGESSSSNIASPPGLKETVSLQGEIVDPKCYFGVMKPGEGKIHKSCAIRCISGGIPPIFRHDLCAGGDYEYYIMLDNNSNKLNENILGYVGEDLRIQAQVNEMHGWKVMYLDLPSLPLTVTRVTELCNVIGH